MRAGLACGGVKKPAARRSFAARPGWETVLGPPPRPGVQLSSAWLVAGARGVATVEAAGRLVVGAEAGHAAKAPVGGGVALLVWVVGHVGVDVHPLAAQVAAG